MSKNNSGAFVEVNGINMHYLAYGTEGPVILMLHSLSANADIFHGLVAKGISNSFQLIIPDLRGRGFTDKPVDGYSLEEQSLDMIAFLDKLELREVIVCGHSFGGLFGAYFAANYPERVSKLVILDAAVELNPLTPFLISYAFMRLLRTYPTWDEYLNMVRKAPFMDTWDASMMPFLRSDVVEDEDGTVRPRTSWIDVSKAAAHIYSISTAEWRKIFGSVKQPALLIQATDPFVHGQHLVLNEKAIQAVALMKNCDHIKVTGNHITMLFSNGASEIVHAIEQFSSIERHELETA
jgi:pimeloyl-ACP methyl ester carboxylesterase